MRYSVLGFNQQKLVEQCENIDIQDILLLDYIWQAQAQPSMQHIIKDKIVFVWLNHSKILEDLPILNIKEEMLKKRIKKLIDFNLIQCQVIANDKIRGSKAFYGITEYCESLRYIEKEDEITGCKKLHVVDESGVKNYTWSEGPDVKNYTSNNTLNKDSKLNISISKEIDNSQKSDFLNFLKNHSKQKSNKAEIQSIVNLYNEVCTNLSKVRALTDKRQKAISNILKSYDFNTIKEVFENANNNSFLTGDNDRGWKADLDFILREDKFVKILENGYGSNKGKGYKKRNKDKFAEPEYLSCERYNPDEDEFGKELDASGKQRYF